MKGCRALTEAEVALVQRSFGGTCAARDKALFLLGVKSGFRISELLSRRVADAPPHSQIADQVTVRRRHMKTRREGRGAPLHPGAKAALAARLLQLRRWRDVTPQTFVFQGRKGVNRPITTVQAWRLLHDAGVANERTGTLGTHAMRKTFAHRVYEKLGRDLVKTQKALGHAAIHSTVSSLSCADEEIHAAILAS